MKLIHSSGEEELSLRQSTLALTVQADRQPSKRINLRVDTRSLKFDLRCESGGRGVGVPLEAIKGNKTVITRAQSRITRKSDIVTTLGPGQNSHNIPLVIKFEKLTVTKCHFEPGIANQNSHKKRLCSHIIR